MNSTVDAALPQPVPKTPPGPRSLVPLKVLRAFRRDPLGQLSRVAREYGDVVKLDLVKTAYFVNHPDHVKQVLVDNHRNYQKNFIYKRLEPMLGKGLLTSNGEFWKRQRRLAQPAFHKQRIAGFAELMVRHTRAMLQTWEQRARAHESIDVHAEMMKLTLVVVADALFSVNVMEDAEDVGRALSTALEITDDRFSSVLILPQAVPTPSNRRFAEAMGVLDHMVGGIIEQRRKSGELGEDLLGMLMAIRDADTGEQMNDQQLRDEVMTMVLAGHETTANALSWTFLLLSQHPAVERRLHEEVVAALGSDAPTVASLQKLRYASMVTDEAMRLYPPIWSIAREAIEDDVIGGFHIPKGASVILAQYTTHRHPQFWDNPEGFDPERFHPDKAAHLHRGAYFPFAAGPRQCIGNSFALMEMPIILSMVSQRFRVDLEPHQDLTPDPTVTLRPRNGLRVKLVPR